MVDKEFHSFLDGHLSKVEPLAKQTNLAYWNATITGKKEDFESYADLQVRLQEIYSSKEEFEQVKSWKNGGKIKDPLDQRQLVFLYYAYLRNQVDSELNKTIIKMGAEIDNKFNVYRGIIDGRSVSSNDIIKTLKESTDSALRKKAWETGKDIGAVVSKELIQLVKLRNEASRSLGYRDFYSMSLDLNEQKEDELLTLFEELERETREPFRRMKSEVDSLLALRFGISTTEIRPWHYEDPFFQRAPQVYEVNLDSYYEKTNILELVQGFYATMGLKADDILTRSDLYEKPGKEQHAYCTDIDRKGDIRILANIKNDENWTGTMLHELGHAVYDKYIDPGLPFLLRQAAHTFSTEAIAMLFGRLSKDAQWIQSMTGITGEESNRIAGSTSKSLRLSQLIFARWCQVMFHFERELYNDPEQNLNQLWWELVENYQFVSPPEGRDAPDWASKIHIVSVPVYYHNYMLGELLASQLSHYIQVNVLKSGGRKMPYNGKPEVGAYLKEKVFSAGAQYRWDKMVTLATGEKLSPKYFVEQFVD